MTLTSYATATSWRRCRALLQAQRDERSVPGVINYDNSRSVRPGAKGTCDFH
jgi:hypothetical protein